MIAEPLSTENDKFVYRIRLVSRIPWRIRRDAARCLRTVRKLASTLADEIPEDSLLSQLGAHRVQFACSMLVPGVKADTVLVMDEASQMRNATVTAPQWDGKRREITMVREDTDGALRGRLDVRFQLELADAPKLSGESVVALLGAAISEAAEIIEVIEVTEVQVAGSDALAEKSVSPDPSPD
jgi:hypothetical protein